MGLNIFDLLALTCDSLRGNPLRSMLTTLGVFMGVAAVSSTLQVRSISRTVIEAELAKREAPQVSLYVYTGDGTPLKFKDLTFLKQRLVGLQAISTSAFFTYDQVMFQDREAEVATRGVSEHYLLTSGRLIVAGRFFNQADFANYRPVVIIDELLADQLFKGENPINQRIYSAGRPYVVVGVMETKLRHKNDEPKGEMLITFSLYNALTGWYNIDFIQMRPYKLEDLKSLEEQAKSLLLQRFPKSEFFARNNADDILQQRQTLDLASQALLAVGGIALLVGGVGIANITIAAVIERTPEIGLRRAIGATQYDIMWQFILEAAILSLIGGVTAIGTVHGLTVMVSQTFELPYQFETGTAALALGSALLVGVGAGLLPAFRASQLDPVKALRSE